jgi:hypothetical protein
MIGVAKMHTENGQIVYANIDFGELPEVRKCRIIKQLTGELRPKDKYYLANIDPPLSPIPACGYYENIPEVVFAFEYKKQDLDSIGKETVIVTVACPGYGKKGAIDEKKSVKLGYANLYSDLEMATENAVTYKEMIWQFRDGNSLDIKVGFDGAPELRKCKIIKKLEHDVNSKDIFYLIEVTPGLSSCPNKTTAIAFIHNKCDLVAVGNGEVTGEILCLENIQGKTINKTLCTKLGDCILYFKF